MMPHLWNNILVVTKGELVPKWYSEAALYKRLNRYKHKDYGIKRCQNGGNNHELLIEFDSLDKEIQRALGDPRKVSHIMEHYYKTDSGTITYYNTFQFDDGSFLKKKHQEKYIVNASVLKAAIALRDARRCERIGKGGSLRNLNETIWSDTIGFNKVLSQKHQVTHSLPANYRRFMDLLKAFEPDNYAALINKKHKNQNGRKVNEETLNLLNSLFAGTRQKPTATDVYEQYNEFLAGRIEVINNHTGEVYNPEDFIKLSDSTVKKYMAAWANKIATYEKRSGNRQTYMAQFKPPHKMKAPLLAGSIISIDDRQPPFKMPDGKRVWFYMAQDLASFAYTCWVHAETKEDLIIKFYRQLVRNYAGWGFNLPNELEAEMSLNSSFRNTFLREGSMFQIVHIEPNNARAKRIERSFRDQRLKIEKEDEAFVPRPHARSESNQPGKDFDKLPTRSYNEIVETTLRGIQKVNNMPHPTQNNISRWKYFTDNQNPELQPINYAGFLPHIGYKTVTSVRNGIIRLNNASFLLGMDGNIALGSNLTRLMSRVEGLTVEIYWLDDNEGQVLKALVYLDDELICEAVKQPEYNRAKIERTDTDQENLELMSAYVSSIQGFMRKRKATIEPITLIDKRTPRFNDFVIDEIRPKPGKSTGEILEDTDEYEAIAEQVSFSRPLKDRF